MSITHKLQQNADKLRRRRSFLLALECASFLAIILYISAAVDYLHPLQEKAAYDIFIYSGSLFLVYLLLRLLFTRTKTPLEMARKIEEAHPEFMNSLVCTVEREHHASFERSVMENALIDQVVEKTSGLNFETVLIPPYLRSSMLMLLLVVVAAVIYPVRSTRLFKKAWNSYQIADSGIAVTPGNCKIEERTNVTITAKVTRWENQVEIIYSQNGNETRIPMYSSNDEARFTFYDVTGTIKYRLETKSLTTPTYTIETFKPPVLEEINVTVEPPKYTRQPSKSYTAVADLNVLEGSKITFNFIISPPGTTGDLITNTKGYTLETLDDTHLAGTITALENQSIKVKLTTKEKNSKTFPLSELAVSPDLPPVVSVIKPDMDFTAPHDKPLPIEVQATDDFGVNTVDMFYALPGKEPVRLKVYNYKEGDKVETDRLFNLQFDPRTFNLPSGTIISYFFMVKDNKEPEGQYSRSELHFVEFYSRGDQKKKKQKGQQGEKKELPLHKLIAELKRLIRETLNITIFTGEDLEKKQLQLSKDLSDLRLEIIKAVDEIPPMASSGDVDISTTMELAADEIELAEESVRNGKFSDALPRETASLTILNRLLRKLAEQQQQSESQSKQKKKQKKKKGEGKPKSLADELNQLKEMLQDLRELSDDQGASNQRYQRFKNSKLSKSTTNQLKDKQHALRQTNEALQEKMQELIPNTAVPELMRRAEAGMRSIEMSVEKNRLNEAYSNGLKTQDALMNATEALEDVINQYVQKKLEEMSQAAKELAEKQNNEASKCQECSSSGNKPGEQQRQGMKDAQDQINKQAENLMKHLDFFNSQLQSTHPDAARELNKTADSQNKIKRHGKRAKNALNFKRYKTAAKSQQETAKELMKLSDTIKDASKKLPRVTRQELLSMMEKIMKQRQELQQKGMSADEMGKKLKNASKLGEAMGKLGEKLNDSSFMEMGTALDMLQDLDPEKAVVDRASAIFQMAAERLRNHLMQMDMDRKKRIDRKRLSPPEKYRELIEEYFKSLSE